MRLELIRGPCGLRILGRSLATARVGRSEQENHRNPPGFCLPSRPSEPQLAWVGRQVAAEPEAYRPSPAALVDAARLALHEAMPPEVSLHLACLHCLAQALWQGLRRKAMAKGPEEEREMRDAWVGGLDARRVDGDG